MESWCALSIPFFFSSLLSLFQFNPHSMALADMLMPVMESWHEAVFAFLSFLPLGLYWCLIIISIGSTPIPSPRSLSGANRSKFLIDGNFAALRVPAFCTVDSTPELQSAHQSTFLSICLGDGIDEDPMWRHWGNEALGHCGCTDTVALTLTVAILPSNCLILPSH